jgi:hypothetical protein
MDSGLFVSLQEKIARQQLVRNLVGNPFIVRVFCATSVPGPDCTLPNRI